LFLFFNQILILLSQILLDNRYLSDEGNDCLLSVDGTDFLSPEYGKKFFSHKFRHSGLRYEVALSIKTGWICWISGPWNPGEWNDIEIFRMSLMTFLEPYERVEADDGYLGEAPLKVRCPKCVTVPAERKEMMSMVRHRQETINKRFKDWKILDSQFRHDVRLHRDVFAAIAVLSQIAIQHNGEDLFEVEYSDRMEE
jgi:hypothetical protein